MKQPNILLIMADQYRGDCFSFKGHPDVQTPNLDSLAAEGINFDHAYSPVPSCIPARAILATGQCARHTKKVGYEDGQAWDYEHFFPELLGQAGYQTQAIGKMHVHPPRKTCGFQNVKLHDGYLAYYRRPDLPHCYHQTVTDDYLHDLKDAEGIDADVNALGIDPNSRIAAPWPYREDLHPTNWVSRECLRFLQTRDREKPFFLMASYVRPHQPYDAPAYYQNLYKDKNLRPPFVGDWENSERTRQHQGLKDSIFGTPDPAGQAEAMQGYYANITHLDHQIGRLILGLQEDGSFEDTIIFFISDHGEQLFDHHTYRKAFPYQGSVQIPFLVRVGKQVRDLPGRDSKTLVGLQDVLPTLVELAGGACPKEVDGLSLAQEILGEKDDKTPARTYLHGEHSFKESCSSQFIVTAEDKYIWFSQTGQEQYFDLIADPHECRDLIRDPNCQVRIQELRQKLIQELAGRPEGFVQEGKLQPVDRVLNELP